LHFIHNDCKVKYILSKKLIFVLKFMFEKGKNITFAPDFRKERMKNLLYLSRELSLCAIAALIAFSCSIFPDAEETQ